MLNRLQLQYYAARVTAARFVHKCFARLAQRAMLMYALSALKFSRVKASQSTTDNRSFSLPGGMGLMDLYPDFFAEYKAFKSSASPAITKKPKRKTKSDGRTRKKQVAREL